MNERRRPPRRGRGPRSSARPVIEQGEPNPYREVASRIGRRSPVERAPRTELATPPAPPPPVAEPVSSGESAPATASGRLGTGARRAAAMPAPRDADGAYAPVERPARGRLSRSDRTDGAAAGIVGADDASRAAASHRASERPQGNPAPMQLVATGETTGWFDPARDGGFIRRAQASYLADAGDAYVSPFLVRQHALRKSDLVAGTTGRDPRGRTALIEITSINGERPGKPRFAVPSSTRSRRRTPSGSSTSRRDGRPRAGRS